MDLRIKSFQEYQEKYKSSVEDPEAFWDEIAQTFKWQKSYDKVCEWEFETPSIKWFVNGKVNITENALDRHLPERANQVAILWEANDPNQASESITYQELFERVCQFANALKAQGVEKGDRVVLYMPMTPELAIACYTLCY